MSYVLGLLFEYNRYHADALIRIYAGNFLVQEFFLEKNINLSVVNGGPSHPGDKMIGIDNPRTDILYVRIIPEKIFLFEIDEKYLTKQIRIEVTNDNNNHTNGFMTKFSYIRFHDIFLIPKSMMYTKTWKILAKRFHRLSRVGKFLYEGEKPEAVDSYWPLTARSEHCVCSHGSNIWTAGLYLQNIGGSFTVKIPLMKKYKTVIMGKISSGKINLYTKYLEILSNFKALNIQR